MSEQFHLAQLNIATFKKPKEDEANIDFVNNLDRVNAEAELQECFIWRLVGDGNDATGLNPFGNESMIVNLSVWRDIESLSAFVYRNKIHRTIMRRREEWFHHMDIYLVLWWVKAGHIPSVEEARDKLDLLQTNGPTADAFTFKSSFPAPVV